VARPPGAAKDGQAGTPAKRLGRDAAFRRGGGRIGAGPRAQIWPNIHGSVRAAPYFRRRKRVIADDKNTGTPHSGVSPLNQF